MRSSSSRRGADILVHEVVSIEGAAAIVERLDPGNEALERHLPEFDRPELWLEAVRPHFAGEVIVGRDLLEVAF